MKRPWTTCPECGCARGEDHKRGCLRRKAGVIMDYSRRPSAAGRSASDYGIRPAPLKPVTDGEPYERRATSTLPPRER